MIGTLRGVSETSAPTVIEAMGRLVEGIAGTHDMRAELDVTPGYPVTTNDDDGAAFAFASPPRCSVPMPPAACRRR